MSRKRAMLTENKLLPIDLFQALQAVLKDVELDEFDEAEAVYAAMELGKSLPSMAHELAGHAIPISSF